MLSFNQNYAKMLQRNEKIKPKINRFFWDLIFLLKKGYNIIKRFIEFLPG